MFLKMTLLALPNLMALVAPLALLVAVIHVLNRLNGDSELIVATAAGATVWNAARPLLVLALLVSLAVSFVNHIGMPWSLRLLRDYVIQVRTDLITQVIQPGRFSSPENNLTFHIRDRSLDGELLGLVMHDARDEQAGRDLPGGARPYHQAGRERLSADADRAHSASHQRDRADADRGVRSLRRGPGALRGQGRRAWSLKPRERYYDELAASRSAERLDRTAISRASCAPSCMSDCPARFILSLSC